MFGNRYFAKRYFAQRYFGHGGSAVAAVVGGHFLPTNKQLRAIKKYENEQRLLREKQWLENERAQEELHQQILNAMHPERAKLLEKKARLEAEAEKIAAAMDVSDEADIEFILLHGMN